MLRVLVVEGEFEVRAALRRGLTAEGFEVITAADAVSALRVGLTNGFDVTVLDVILPDLPGYSVLRRFRAAGVKTPVLLISANGSEDERVEALNLGGDGYLAVPFPFALLVAQLRALSRRYRGSWLVGRPLQIGGLNIEPKIGMVAFRGQEIQLTPRECELLHALMSRPDTVLGKRELARLIWGPNRVTNNNVEAHISQLRRKLYAVGAGELVRTLRGYGYMFDSHAGHDVQESSARTFG